MNIISTIFALTISLGTALTPLVTASRHEEGERNSTSAGAAVPVQSEEAYIHDTAAEASDSVSVSAARLADMLIEEAYRYLGTPYKYGASGPRAFDCSGFARFVYGKFGFQLSRSSRAQATDGRPVEGFFSDLQKGDLLIFGARANRKTVGHVGIFIGLDSTGTDFAFIHAARGGVMVSRISEEYYDARFMGVRRILPDFLPEPEPDTVNQGVAETYIGATVTTDRLSLGATDSRIVLFGDGTWARVGEDGTVSGASGDDRIILNANGTWDRLRTSIMRVPSLSPVNSGSASTRPQSSQAEDPADASETQYHTIRSGDTLGKIASQYHTSIDRLCSLNGISRTTILHIGQRLRVK